MKFTLLSVVSASALLVAANPAPSNFLRHALHARQGVPGDIPPECEAQCAPVAACGDATCACTPAFSEALSGCLACGVTNGFLTQADADTIVQGNAAQCAAATGTDGTVSPTPTDTDVPTDTGATGSDTVTPTPTETDTGVTTTPTTTPTTPPTTATTPPPTTRSTTSQGTQTQTSSTESDNGARPTGVVRGVMGAGVMGAVAALVVL